MVIIRCVVSVLLSITAVRAGEDDTSAKSLGSANLHNLFRVADDLYSGSSPDNEEAFRELKKLGVKVILTVDGAKPNVALAHQYGMRYVHLPISYDGVPQKRGTEFAKVLTDAGGPVYIHCHHGKHRGPAAAATALMAVKGWSTERAETFLKQAGTAPEYAGLYRDVRAFRRPTAEELASLPSTFPETAEVPQLVDAMVTIDEHFDVLKAAQKAGWPAVSGASTPAQTATLLWEGFRELRRDPSTDKHGAEYRRELEKAERVADTLRTALADATATAAARDEALKATAQSCTTCHKAHRN